MRRQPDTDRLTFRKTTLDSGLRVITSEMRHSRSVSISAFVGVGSRHEPDDRAGISHFIEHLLFKGTERRPTPSQVSGVVEGVGGVLNAATEQELTVYWCKVARAHFEEAMDLLLDMLLNSRFDPVDLDKERMVVFEELGMSNDDPNYRVDMLIDALLWPQHPLGRDIAGTRDTVAGITRDMVLEHMFTSYSASNTVISVAGYVDHDDVVRCVASLSDGWHTTGPPPWTPFSPDKPAARVAVEYRSTEQAHLSIALPGLSITHPDRYALDLLSVVLGEGMSSRLFLELRENQGLAYDIHSSVSHLQDCGAFVVTAGVDPKRIHEAVRGILSEVGRMRETVPTEELEKAKRLSAGRLLLQMEDTRAVSGWAGAQELLRGAILDVGEVVDRINQVTSDDVRRLACELLVGSKLKLAVIGPIRGRKRLEQMLAL